MDSAAPPRPPLDSARARLIGALLVFVSGIAFSTKAVLVKLAYRHGVDSVSLLALRFGGAAPFFAIAAFGGRLSGKRPAALSRNTCSRSWAWACWVTIWLACATSLACVTSRQASND